jgi:nucleotide-binding universal stress UspA family protein
MAQKRIALPLFRTIVFATDLSDRSAEAFRMACSVAREEATRLIILTVEEPVPVTEGVGFGEMGVPVYLPAAEASQRDELLRQMRERFIPGLPIDVEYQVRQGQAADEILKVVEETKADLLALGTHGRTGLDRLLMGSVAERVMRHAPCACLAVRSAAATKPIRTILHPTDFSPHSEGALRVARALAREHGARLVLVHVVPMERAMGVVPEVLMDLDIGREALRDVQNRIEAADLKFPVEAHLKRGEPAETILDAAREYQADLVVMGSHGRTGLGRLLLGSVAEQVLRGATCPVLTVKQDVPAPVGQPYVAASLKS